MPDVGDKGGIGHSWFTIELSSLPVYDEGTAYHEEVSAGYQVVVPVPPVPLPGGGYYSREKYAGVVKYHEEQDGEYLVVVAVTETQLAYYNVVAPRVEVASAAFSLVSGEQEEVTGTMLLSTHMKVLRLEDEEILLLV